MSHIEESFCLMDLLNLIQFGIKNKLIRGKRANYYQLYYGAKYTIGTHSIKTHHKSLHNHSDELFEIVSHIDMSIRQ